jgi:hypothetical protein
MLKCCDALRLPILTDFSVLLTSNLSGIVEPLPHVEMPVSHSEMPKQASQAKRCAAYAGSGEIDTSNESAPSQQIALASPSFASSASRISKQFKQKHC